MQRLEVRGAVRPIYGSLGVKRLITGLSSGTKSCSYAYYKELFITFLKTRCALEKAENIIEK